MADFGVFIGFGFPARGREQGAIKVFQELLEFLGGQAQQGNIDGLEPVFLQPHGGELGGYIVARGDRSKLDAMVASQEFQRLVTRAQIIVENFGVVNCVIGPEVENQVGTFLGDTSDLR